MVSRKRSRQEMEAVEPSKERSLIERIRSMWEFANLAQWIFIFGRAVKIDENLDIEDLEMECLKSHSTILPEIGLSLLKFVSSHRGLTPEIFDEYTRRQYVAKAPHKNPFGEEVEPKKFIEFDVFTKIRVLQQLTQWTMGNPDRIRERMEEHKDSEQTIWRIEPFGWDSDDRTYFVLDDNRLYRQTDPPPPPPPTIKSKKNSKKAKAALRASKRRKVSEPAESEVEHVEEAEVGDSASVEKDDDGFGGMTWECLAITLDEFNTVIASIDKSRDPNEKVLRKRIVDDVLPLLEKQEEARKRKAAQKERELLNLEKLATAKRSSRIAGKMEQQKQDEEARDAERKKHTELIMAKKEQEKWLKLEKERESRMMTREQRVKERDARRILHEEELANLSEDNKKIESGEGRLSERHLKAEIERKKQALEDLAEEEDWIFDCICGAYGQIDDGTHSIACEKCSIWQHSKCVGVSQAEADREDFHFICKTCERRAKDEERAKNQPPIKIKLNRPGSSSSPMPPKQNTSPTSVMKALVNGSPNTQSSPQKPQEDVPIPYGSPVQHAKQNGPQLASWQTRPAASPKFINQGLKGHEVPPMQPPRGNETQVSPQRPAKVKPTVSPSNTTSNAEDNHHTTGYTGPHQSCPSTGTPTPQSLSRPSSAHAFSPPHPQSPLNLPPPGQPHVYNFVNGNNHSVNGSPCEPSQTPVNYATPRFPQIQSSPSLLASHGYGATPVNHLMNGSRPGSSEGGHRRSSMNMQSPLVGAPVLTPSNKTNNVHGFSGSSSPIGIPTAATQPRKPSSVEGASSPTLQATPQQDQDPSHASALPPSVSGLSPTKHSPPRPTTSNGSFGSATPSILPPVTSLSPSPQMQNLSPPVKQSEPEWNRPNSQILHQ